MAKRRCKGTTKKGKRCQSPPIEGTDLCISHSPKAVQANVGFGGAENGAKGGSARKVPKLTEVLRERVEDRAEEIIDKLLDGLDATRAVVVGTGPKARVEIVPDQDQVRKTVADIYDRFEGRPRQVSEISGPDGGEIPIGTAIPNEADWHRAVIALGEQVGVGANGNGSN